MAERKPLSLDQKDKQSEKAFDTFLESIKDKKASVSQSAQEAKSRLKSIRTIEKKGQAELSKISTDTAKRFNLQSEDISAKAEKIKTTMDASLSDIDAIRSEAKSSYARFNQTYKAAMAGKNGIAARKNDAVARHEKIRKVHEQVNELGRNTKEKASEVKTAHENSKIDGKQVADIRARAEEIKTEIENTYHIAVDSAMGGALNSRKKEIENLMKFWAWTLLATVFLLIMAIGALIYLSMHPELNGGGRTSLLESVTNRLVYLTPLLFVIFLSYKRYTQERRLLEEYAFKASMAQTLRSYTVLLSDNYHNVKGADEKILNFLLNSMTNIYDRSTLDDTSGFFYQLAIGGKHLGAHAIVQEGSSEVKQTTTKKVKSKTETL